MRAFESRPSHHNHKKKMKSNEQLVKLVKDLKQMSLEKKAGLWKRIALDLEKSTKSRRIVNLYRINKHSNEKETTVVPGKVLGVGEIDKKVTVAAFSFSSQARDKINKVGKAITIQDLMKLNPKPSEVRIIG
ncbi:50S ribosomal protein L18e [Nanoarchaeota archaeon]